MKMPLLTQLRLLGLPNPVPELQFHKTRKWRFDFAWPEQMIACEIEGGTKKMGRHNRHDGYQKDCEKYNEAQLLGWTVLRFTSEMVGNGSAAKVLEKALKQRRQ